ncbi:MAG: hypothetical protein ACD_40C00037G0011 [uncultured bacterium]|nr:MAG: hypothetical protein ACD_40C00037G0011 [uncultured bacterium]KKU25764.1 MAG: Type I restriction modification DNA specificity domain protein [Microgenomates group bacterium GW2011_GWA2_46_16]
MNYSTILKSQLEEPSHRLDAEYYQPQYLEVVEQIKNVPHTTLESISSSLRSFGAYALTNQIVWKESGIPFITAENVKEGLIDYTSQRYIDADVDRILSKSRVYENEVLLSMSGKVGDAAIAINIPNQLNSNQDIVKIKLKSDFSPYLLTVFLNCKYGKLQVLRLPVGSVQQHIFLWQTKSLLIPKFSNEITLKVEKLYKKSLDQHEQGSLLYAQAENILLDTLGLKEFNPKNINSCIVNLSDVQSVNRLDADYFQPKYAELINQLTKFNLTPLTKVINNVTAKFNPLAHPDQQFRYVELADIDSTIGIINHCSEITGKEAPSRAKRLLKEGDVIVSSIEGSLNKTALVEKQYDGSLASTGFFQLRSSKFLPEVILIMAKSIILQMQLTRECAGTILTAVPKESLNRILVPEIKIGVQKQIASLVQESHLARQKSKELLEQAKKTVEDMIEKGTLLEETL